jgi:hypothetical protein
MRNNQMMCDIDGDLEIIADNSGTGRSSPSSGNRFGQRDLLVRYGEHFRGSCWCTSDGLMPVGSVELLQIAREALLDLAMRRAHLGAGEGLIAVVSVVDRDAGFREQAHRAAQREEACAHFADGGTIVPTESAMIL